MVDKLLLEFSKFDEVEALAIGGSRGRGIYDEKSDYDIYVYLNSPLDKAKRKTLMEKYCHYIELGNKFWEEEDDCILNSGVDIEFIYRRLEDIQGNIEDLLINQNGRKAYTTCFWESLLSSKVIFDRNGRYEEMLQKYNVEIPKGLKKNIIEENNKLLMDYMPALYYQVKKSVGRGDFISINHRITEYLGIYFDVIYALNDRLHRGEKRLLELTEGFEMLPKNYRENIEELFKSIYQDDEKFLKLLEDISMELYLLLKEQGYDVTINSCVFG